MGVWRGKKGWRGISRGIGGMGMGIWRDGDGEMGWELEGWEWGICRYIWNALNNV